MSLHVARLPEAYRSPARQTCRRLLDAYPNTVCLVVIGSVAMGTHAPDSDLDIVWVHRGRLRRRWYDEVGIWDQDSVELVPLTMKHLRRHFRQHSPLAHTIQHGLPLYDPERLLPRWQARLLGPPTREWIDETHDFMRRRFAWGMDSYRDERAFHRQLRHADDGCDCRVSEVLTRATLNLVRLLLILDGHVPLTKAHTRQLYPRILRGPRLRRGMEVTLNAHHQRRDLTLGEAHEVAHLGQWARRQLAPGVRTRM